MHVMALGQATPGHEPDAPGPLPEIALGQFGAEYDFALAALQSAVSAHINLANEFLGTSHKKWGLPTVSAALDAIEAFWGADATDDRSRVKGALSKAIDIADERFGLLEWATDEIKIMVAEERDITADVAALTTKIDDGILMYEALLSSPTPEDQSAAEEWRQTIKGWIAQAKTLNDFLIEANTRIDRIRSIVQGEQAQHAAYVQGLRAVFEETNELTRQLLDSVVVANARLGDYYQKLRTEAALRQEQSLWEKLESFVKQAGTTFLWILGGVAGLSIILALTRFFRK